MEIALNKHGTRALQNLLNLLKPFNAERSQIISESFKDNVMDLGLNIHGNHVVQICLENFTREEHKEPIYRAVLQNCS